MIKASHNDKTLLTELLTKSFEENLSVNYVIQQDDKKLKRIRLLMEYSIEMCFLFGEIWLSNDKKACALILYPHKKRTTLSSVFLDLNLIFRVIGVSGFGKVMSREVLIKKKQPKEKMVYLWFIGVNPLYQHSGIGSLLLKEVLADVEKKGLPVYLETSTEKNLPWYQRFGFTIYDKLVFSYVLHFLKYKPVK